MLGKQRGMEYETTHKTSRGTFLLNADLMKRIPMSLFPQNIVLIQFLDLQSHTNLSPLSLKKKKKLLVQLHVYGLLTNYEYSYKTSCPL